MVIVDTVYQRVLAIANKEQRGYITPQEFNLFANQAQMDIFEQYFYDLNQFLRIPGNDGAYSDMVNILQEKINIFETTSGPLTLTNDVVTFPPNTYRLGSIHGDGVEIERLERKDFVRTIISPLTQPSLTRPICFVSGNTATISPTGVNSAEVFYVVRPGPVAWGYIVTNEKALYNASTSFNFQLHPSEETDLVIKILQLAGILMEDQLLIQVASQEDAKNDQQEKK
jgi:hypothetical protein